nr:hypothetical protein [Candidatus Sigynarchaeum springense]
MHDACLDKDRIECPWCGTGSMMALLDDQGSYCLACKRDLLTGELMRGWRSERCGRSLQ